MFRVASPVADVTEAADQLRAVPRRLGRDGRLRVHRGRADPRLRHGRTVAEGRRLWARVDRPNVMVKVPGTVEGLPAIEQLIADGVNVNVTLLFFRWRCTAASLTRSSPGWSGASRRGSRWIGSARSPASS